MNVKTITMGVFVSLILLTLVGSQSTFTAYDARPDVGFQDGLSVCRSGISYAINGHSNA